MRGHPKWNTPQEFERIAKSGVVWDKVKGNTNQWDRTFVVTKKPKRRATWPMPIYEEEILVVHRPGSYVVYTYTWQGSPGGWLRRAVGWPGQYRCMSKDRAPEREQMIKF
jgi:hypothetical protein